AIIEAKNRLGCLRVVVDSPHVIAELSFGFWTSLLGRRFEHSLWVPALRQVFPRIGKVSGIPSRRLVAERFEHLRVFRNRIAHHEPIFPRNLASDYASLLEVTAWMYEDVADWTDSISTCNTLLSMKPS